MVYRQTLLLAPGKLKDELNGNHSELREVQKLSFFFEKISQFFLRLFCMFKFL